MTFKRCDRWTRPIALLAVSCLVLLALNTAVVAASSGPRAMVASAPPRSLIVASARSRQADRVLVSSANELKSCRRANSAHPKGCKSDSSAVQRAGAVLARAERRLASIARATGRRASNHVASASRLLAPRRAPLLAVSGYTLRWTRVDRLNSYLLERKVPGQAAQYSVVRGTSITPPPVPGVVVRYSVRTTAYLSAWAHEQPIGYPSAPATADGQAAPVITVSGKTLIWSPIANVSTYVLASRTLGKPIQYTVVGGTSVTPEPVPGATVGYSIRTAVDGSVWAPEVTISYPSSGTSAPGSSSEAPGGGTTAPGSSSEAPGGGTTAPGSSSEFSEPFLRGIVENPDGWGEGAAPHIAAEIHELAAEWVRVDLPWKDVMPSPGVYNWSNFDNVVRVTEGLGLHILPILGYAPSWTSPTDATGYAQFVAAAVARYGPGTSANLPWFELWNEPYFPFAWSGKTPEPEAYARDVLAASEAAKKNSPSVKLLVAGEYGDAEETGGTSRWETSWVSDMFTAAPNLGKWIDGVAVHPYGDDPALPVTEPTAFRDATGGWSFQRIDSVRAQFLAHGVNVPFWITEVGWSTYNMSETEQAHNYADLVTQVVARPWIRAMFPYCLREFQEHPRNDESQTGLLKFGTEQPKLAFYTLQRWYKTLG
jgi:hypothetical protein